MDDYRYRCMKQYNKLLMEDEKKTVNMFLWNESKSGESMPTIKAATVADAGGDSNKN